MENLKSFEVIMVHNMFSHEFADFTKAYGFQHITSSPRFPQSNGEAECMVKTIKGLLRSSSDPHLAVLSYRVL